MKIRLPKHDWVWYGMLAFVALFWIGVAALFGLIVTSGW